MTVPKARPTTRVKQQDNTLGKNGSILADSIICNTRENDRNVNNVIKSKGGANIGINVAAAEKRGWL